MTEKKAPERRKRSPAPCPVCKEPAAAAFTPFCSQRCADIDLGRWLGERYVIPGPDSTPGEGPDEDG